MLTVTAPLSLLNLPGVPVVRMTLTLPGTAEGEGLIELTNRDGDHRLIDLPAPLAQQLTDALADIVPELAH